MFCKNCGEKLNDTAKFCHKCGREIKSRQMPKLEDNIVKLRIIPEFILGYKVLSNIGVGIIYAFFIILSILYIGASTDTSLMWIIKPSTYLYLLLFVVLYTIIKTIFDAKQYKKLEYSFYNTKIEYKDGFINKEEKELNYKYIREITVSQNVLERMYNLGRIKIYTNASSGNTSNGSHSGMSGRNGIYIHCVKNVQEEYIKIKQLVDEGVIDES